MQHAFIDMSKVGFCFENHKMPSSVVNVTSRNAGVWMELILPAYGGSVSAFLENANRANACFQSYDGTHAWHPGGPQFPEVRIIGQTLTLAETASLDAAIRSQNADDPVQIIRSAALLGGAAADYELKVLCNNEFLNRLQGLCAFCGPHLMAARGCYALSDEIDPAARLIEFNFHNSYVELLCGLFPRMYEGDADAGGIYRQYYLHVNPFQTDRLKRYFRCNRIDYVRVGQLSIRAGRGHAAIDTDQQGMDAVFGHTPVPDDPNQLVRLDLPKLHELYDTFSRDGVRMLAPSKNSGSGDLYTRDDLNGDDQNVALFSKPQTHRAKYGRATFNRWQKPFEYKHKELAAGIPVARNRRQGRVIGRRGGQWSVQYEDGYVENVPTDELVPYPDEIAKLVRAANAPQAEIPMLNGTGYVLINAECWPNSLYVEDDVYYAGVAYAMQWCYMRGRSCQNQIFNVRSHRHRTATIQAYEQQHYFFDALMMCAPAFLARVPVLRSMLYPVRDHHPFFSYTAARIPTHVYYGPPNVVATKVEPPAPFINRDWFGI